MRDLLGMRVYDHSAADAVEFAKPDPGIERRGARLPP